MKQRIDRQSRGVSRRAVTAPLVAVSMVVLLGFTALAIDLGYIYVATGEMQAATDASALAGASALLDGHSLARQRAIEYAGLNSVATQAVQSNELTLTIGVWEGLSRTFTPAENLGVDDVLPNAIQVYGTRDNLGLYFAPIFGTSTTRVRKKAVALVGSGTCAGVWGLEGIMGDGNIMVDSYDSSNGAYGAGNKHPNGDICSCQDIVLNGSVEIWGDARYGDGYSFTAGGNAYNVYGVVDDQACGTPSYNADFADAAINNDNLAMGLSGRGRDPFGGSQWDFVLTGNDSLNLPGGTFYFTSVLIDGQAALTINGPTTIFITGPAVFTGGGIINATGDPNNLIIYSNGPTLTLTGGSGFYGAVVAPQTDILMWGSGEYWGTILGRTLDMDGDSNIHVDETLIMNLFGIERIQPVLVE